MPLGPVDRDDPVREAKRVLRARMRTLRGQVADRDRRTDALWAHVVALPEVIAARVVMAFQPVGSEPDTAPLLAWCEAAGKRLVVPAADRAALPPDDPGSIDVVIVPGLAFTAEGGRLGQGGGWYDRFLRRVRADCVTIGVGFGVQVVEELPTEPHDVVLDRVVTEDGVLGDDPPAEASRRRRGGGQDSS